MLVAKALHDPHGKRRPKHTPLWNIRQFKAMHEHEGRSSIRSVTRFMTDAHISGAFHDESGSYLMGKVLHAEATMQQHSMLSVLGEDLHTQRASH